MNFLNFKMPGGLSVGAGNGFGGQKVDADRLFHGGGYPVWEMPAGSLIRIRAIKGCAQILKIHQKMT